MNELIPNCRARSRDSLKAETCPEKLDMSNAGNTLGGLLGKK
jgi:hypothetical protein